MKQQRLPLKPRGASLRRKLATAEEYLQRDRRAMELMKDGLSYDDAYSKAFDEQELLRRPLVMTATG